ncbi:MAG: YbhB/YbcL family Raf kinase inhibitor-like protein [Actinomycetota bacterium]
MRSPHVDARALAPLARRIVALSLVALAACTSTSRPSASCTPPNGLATCVSVPSLTVTSRAFANGGRIPAAYTCDGGDHMPGLEWSAVPASARSIEVVVRDVDADYFVHYDRSGIPPNVRNLDRGTPRGSEQTNSFGMTRYRGPCPPKGSTYHRYVFEVRALDAHGGLVALGTLVGTYARA